MVKESFDWLFANIGYIILGSVMVIGGIKLLVDYVKEEIL